MNWINIMQWPPLDKGWAWSILVAASLMLFCVNGTNRAQGITYQVIETHLHGSSTVSSLAVGLQMSLKFLLAFLGKFGVHRFGARVTVMAGSLIQASGVLLSLLATEDWHFLLTFGVIGGTGAAMAYTGCMITLREYFEKHRVLAFSISAIFRSIGHTVHPMILGWVTYFYGYHGFLFTWAGIVLQVCISGALCRPLEANYRNAKIEDQGSPHKEKLDLEVAKHALDSSGHSETKLTESSSLIQENSHCSEDVPMIYHLFLISTFCCTLAYHPPLVFIVSILIERGASVEMGSTVVGLGNLFVVAQRVVLAIVLYRPTIQPYRRLIFCSAMLLSAGSCVGLAFFTGLWPTYLCYTLVSSSITLITTLCLIILGDIISRTYFPTGLSTLGIIQGIGYLLGPFLCGVLRDWSGNYTVPLIYSSFFYLLAFLLLYIPVGSVYLHDSNK